MKFLPSIITSLSGSKIVKANISILVKYLPSIVIGKDDELILIGTYDGERCFLREFST